MAAGLILLEIAYPLASFEENYALSLSLISDEVSFIFLPVIPLHPHEILVGFITFVGFADNTGVSIVLDSSTMKFTCFEFTFVSDPFFIPIQLSVSLHLSFDPISQV